MYIEIQIYVLLVQTRDCAYRKQNYSMWSTPDVYVALGGGGGKENRAKG